MKRGRKSASELAVVIPIGVLPTRPKPPRRLDKVQRARWAEIVDDWPADHWRPSDLRLIESVILTESYVRDCDAAIKRDGMTMERGTGGTMTHPAITQRQGHLQALLALQRALRLCPSTRTRAEKASLHERPGAGGKRPWEK